METHAVGENPDDLRAWMLALEGGPTVTHVQVQQCREDSAHGDDRPFWFFAEADARHGVARLRCVACGQAHSLFDSDERWTYPPMHACGSCEQSMVEVAVGVHAEQNEAGEHVVTWAAIGARCVMCGRLEGLTDVILPEPHPPLETIDTVL
jgi:hypothetical protein